MISLAVRQGNRIRLTLSQKGSKIVNGTNSNFVLDVPIPQEVEKEADGRVMELMEKNDLDSYLVIDLNGDRGQDQSD